jgi:hypothetical protein
MSRFITDLTSIEKIEEFNQDDIFKKIKEIMDGSPEESPTFALTTMVIDSFKEGGSISKVSKEIKISTMVPVKFIPC